MKSKHIFLGILATIVLGIMVLFSFNTGDKNMDAKTIHVTVKDMHHNEILYDEMITTEVSTLADFLQGDNDLEVVGEMGAYGYYISSMLGASEGDGYYWVFESDNNQDCLDYGYCPAADQVDLVHQDEFNFILTNVFE